MNLAGVLPWIHWRGLLILGLLAAGNVFCMACPFLLPRTLARRWLPTGWSWPRRLRSKWLAVRPARRCSCGPTRRSPCGTAPGGRRGSPSATSSAAFVIDGFFRGAAFCKYLCPIGQFNFVQSLVSPLEVKVRDPDVCAACRTKDCIRGRDGIPGCELHLFQPRKAGNMDCTFCLDCVHACPHDNVGMLAGAPGSDLWHDPPSLRRRPLRQPPRPGGPGRGPGVRRLRQRRGHGRPGGGVAGPARVLCWGMRSPLAGDQPVLPARPGRAAVAGRRRRGRAEPPWGRLDGRHWLEVATRFSYALVPLGFGMWLAHYSFHFLTSYDTVVPVTQRFAGGPRAGRSLGEPDWGRACCRPVADWLPRLEILFLDLGLLLSLYTGYRIAWRSRALTRALKALAPWALLMVLLFAAGVWIVFQPMQMRGTLFEGEVIDHEWQRDRLSLRLAGHRCSFLLPPSVLSARADGGAVRLAERAGGYQIAVFTSPDAVPGRARGRQRARPGRRTGRMRAGGAGHGVPEGARGRTGPGMPGHHGGGDQQALPRSRVRLPEPGWWDVAVAVEGPHGPARVRFGVEADEPPPRWLALWPWFALAGPGGRAVRRSPGIGPTEDSSAKPRSLMPPPPRPCAVS